MRLLRQRNHKTVVDLYTTKQKEQTSHITIKPSSKNQGEKVLTLCVKKQFQLLSDPVGLNPNLIFSQ